MDEMSPKEAAAWIASRAAARRDDPEPGAPPVPPPASRPVISPTPTDDTSVTIVGCLFALLVMIGLYFVITKWIESEAKDFSQKMDREFDDPNSDFNKKLDRISRDAERELQEELRRRGR